jgi:hypothetical protein
MPENEKDEPQQTTDGKVVYGTTPGGRVIDDELIEQWADEAERGYDIEHLLERRSERESPS